MKKLLLIITLFAILVFSSNGYSAICAPDDLDCECLLDCKPSCTYEQYINEAKRCYNDVLQICDYNEMCNCYKWIMSNPCADKVCKTGSCLNGACTWTNMPDGTACTGGTCQNGVCISCTPSCTNKVCGDSDGCGGICTKCPTGLVCISGSCQCTTLRCAFDEECCPGQVCELAEDEEYYKVKPGYCENPPAPPPSSSPCPGGDAYWIRPGDSAWGCVGWCPDSLDFDSEVYEKSCPNCVYNIVMEDSSGSNVWKGRCLDRPGVAENTEQSSSYYDYCVGPARVRKWALDGCAGCDDRNQYVDRTCPNHLACRGWGTSGNNNDKTTGICPTSCTVNSDCYPQTDGDGQCGEGLYWCSSGHCCLECETWDTSRAACVPQDECTDITIGCSLPIFTGTPYLPKTNCWVPQPTSPSYTKACCNTGFQNSKADYYDWEDVKILTSIA